MIHLTSQEMEKQGTHFNEKMSQALQDGFFYVEIPETLREKTEKVIEYVNGIRDNTSLKTANLGNAQLGYQERHGSQAVAFSAMSHQWEQVFPTEVVEVARSMNALAVGTLKAALQHLSIPEAAWAQATGKLTDGAGSNVFTTNHYKPGEQKIGLIPHKDMGWITVLFIDKRGLETSKDGKQWEDVPPQKGYFVINFGRAFEILVNSTDKLRASLHRVRRLEEERMSFGIFINHTEGSPMYQIDDQNRLSQVGNYDDYLQKCFSEFDALQKQLSEQENK